MDFFEPDHFQDGYNPMPYVAVILGESGSGKTLFGRCIFDNLKKRRDFMRDHNLP
jgi:ABC-type dipeptide/oligopeptide/nickel transport system ATPase component